MRISVVVSVLLFAAACSLQSQRLSTESTAAVEQEILRAENRLPEALNALDDTALDALWADRLVFVGTNGHSSTKAQRLSGMDVPPAVPRHARLDSRRRSVETRIGARRQGGAAQLSETMPRRFL